MAYHFSYYVLPLLASGCVALGISVYCWRRSLMPSAVFLGNMAFASAVWSFGYALEIAGADLATKVFWGKVQYFGIVMVPFAWVVFAFLHAAPGRLPKPSKMLLLSIIPTLTLVLTFTTQSHGLVWSSVTMLQSGDFSALSIEHGVWFWVNIAYTYVLLLVGAVVLLRVLWRTQALYQRQGVMLGIAIIAPWLGNALYISGRSPIPYLDLTPFAFTISAAMGALAVFGYHLGSIAPVGRDLIVENMVEGVVIVDLVGRIVDINPAAGDMIGIPGGQAVGKSIHQVLAPWPIAVQLVNSGQEGRAQISLGEGEGQITYDLRTSLLYDRQKVLLGRMITIWPTRREFVPRTAYSEPEIAEPTPQPVEAPIGSQQDSNGYLLLLRRLRNFVRTPILTDLPTPPHVNPKWHQARERSFTVILRVAALVGSVALLFAPTIDISRIMAPFAFILGLIWVLGVARKMDYSLRIYAFLVLVGALAVIEIYTYGYSVEGFIFFMAMVVSATLLLGPAGGGAALLAAVAYIGVIGVMIGAHSYMPMEAAGNYVPLPHSVQSALSATLVFAACAGSLIMAVAILMQSLNSAWEMETQARHLLQQERDLLEYRVTERTRELAQASQFKSQLLSRVSHELRTPLSGILGYSELLLSSVFGELNQRQITPIERILESSKYLAVLVNDLLDQAQIESRKINLSKASFAPEHLAAQVQTHLALLAEKRGLELRVEVAQPFPDRLYGDETRLRQILVNLGANAIKFTNSGCVQIRLYRQDEQYWAMQVQDTGIGISKEAQEYIFEPFRQVESANTKNVQGTGLGLSIVKQLVQLMDGVIWLESEPNRGSTFTILLPIITPEEVLA